MTRRDNRDYIRVLLYSYYATITGWGVLLRKASVQVHINQLPLSLREQAMDSGRLRLLRGPGVWVVVIGGLDFRQCTSRLVLGQRMFIKKLGFPGDVQQPLHWKTFKTTKKPTHEHTLGKRVASTLSRRQTY